MPAFDFAAWAALYETDPVQFQAQRKALLCNMVTDSALSEVRKARLLAQVLDPFTEDKGPDVLLYAAQQLMWESLQELRENLKALHITVSPDGSVCCRRTALSLFAK